MKYTEKTSVSPITGEYRFIERINDDGTITIIPMDEANSDYQAYLDRDKPKAALSTPIVSGDAD